MMHIHSAGPTAHSKGWFARSLLALALVAAVFSQFKSRHAQQAAPELPTEPILRIESGQHVAGIPRIDTDAANKFAVTASHDKTVRVWSLPDGRLQRVLRLPIDYGYIGEAYAVAISPDGSTVAVGGLTGIPYHHNIFLFDRASGAMNQQLSDLPNVINHMAYSADGQRLAASLFSDGIRIYDALNDYRSLPSDAQYGDQSYGVQFDPTGRLLTVSFDGVVRLYAADQYATPVARFEWKGHRPYSAAFSPEGARVAVADGATHDVVVLSGSDLTQLFKADTTGIADDRNVHAVAWSQDGRFLYAGGTWSVNGVRQVRRWDDGGSGAYVDVPTAPNNLVELIGLKSGSMLVGNAVGLELIGPDAKVTQMQGFGGLDLSIVGDPLLRVSAVFSDVQRSVKYVSVQYDGWPKQYRRFVRIQGPWEPRIKHERRPRSFRRSETGSKLLIELVADSANFSECSLI